MITFKCVRSNRYEIIEGVVNGPVIGTVFHVTKWMGPRRVPVSLAYVATLLNGTKLSAKSLPLLRIEVADYLERLRN